MSTFLITTATGRQGASTAKILIASGANVNALVRDPTSPQSKVLEKLGARLFKGDLKDAAAVEAAIKGVTGVFLNTFPDPFNPLGELPQAELVISAARAAGTVKSIVVSTVVGVDFYPDWSALGEDFVFLPRYFGSKASVEQAVRQSGFKYTILRPGMLYHNFIGEQTNYHYLEYRSDRILTISYPKGFRLAQLDGADVGKVAAKALLEPKLLAGREIDLQHEPLSYEEMAEILSKAIGTDIKVKYRTDEETSQAKRKMPAVEAQLWWSNVNSKGDPSELEKLGIHLTTFKEFVEREKTALAETLGL